MTIEAPRLKLKDVDLDLNHTQARLNQLELHEWLRWGVAFVIMLALTFALFVLSIPVIGGRNWTEQTELNIGLRALLGIVLLFYIFVARQQLLISRLRRDLAIQLRVVTTLETLKTAHCGTNGTQMERRHIQRSSFDRRLRVNTFHQGKPTCVHGRIRDISEDGIGAVIPCFLHVDEQVTLEFSIGNGHEGTVSAIVRHRQGFHYGFEFVSIEPSSREAIAKMMETTAVPHS